MTLPEIPDTKRHAALRATNITQPAGAGALGGIQPGQAGLGTFADFKRIGAQLREGVITKGGNHLETIRHTGRPFTQGRSCAPFNLCLANRLARVATQAGDTANRFTEKAIAFTGKAHVPIMQRAVQRRIKADAHTPYKIGFLVTVVNHGVHHAHRVIAGVEIKAHHKGNPGTAVLSDMLTFQFDHRAHRSTLLKGHLVELSGEGLYR